MTSFQIAEWMAYDRLEPFGETRADLRNAILCQLVSSIVASKEAPLPKIQEFLPDFDSQWTEEVFDEVEVKDPGDDELLDSKKTPGLILSQSTKSSLTLYDGEAPVIKRIGKRASNTGKKVVQLREILKRVREEEE